MTFVSKHHQQLYINKKCIGFDEPIYYSSLYYANASHIYPLKFCRSLTSVDHLSLQVAFAQRAIKDPELRMVHNVHKACSLLGGVLFVADDVFPQIPFIHAAWHLAAAVGVGTCNKLLE